MSLLATTHRLEFAPPPAPGILRALGLALLAHALLMVALTWGVNWRHQASPFVAEAELWSAVPQAAAPKLVEPPPAPAVTQPQPAPEPELKTPAPDIVAERDKQKTLNEKKALEKTRLLEDKKQDDLKKADLKKQDAKRKDDQKTQAEENRLELQRQENIKRMAGLAGLAGASGAPTATGTAQQSSGPSATYAGRIRARIKPNIVFGDDVAGNPTAEVEVKAAADGTITSRKLIKSSGITAWDEAVLKAIDKTEVLPKDTDGRVPSVLVIGFRPKDN